MLNCNPVGIPTEIGLKLSRDLDGVRVDTTFYKHIVGSLMYLTSTRSDIMYVMSLIRRYMENPTQLHLRAAKRIFRYLKGTTDLGILYKRGEKPSFFGFTYSDYVGDITDRKNTSGHVFLMSSSVVSQS